MIRWMVLLLACCATLRSDITVEAAIEEEEDAENHPLRDLVGRVARVKELTPTVRGIWLEVPDDFRFQPGQYVNVHVPGVAGARSPRHGRRHGVLQRDRAGDHAGSGQHAAPGW